MTSLIYHTNTRTLISELPTVLQCYNQYSCDKNDGNSIVQNLVVSANKRRQFLMNKNLICLPYFSRRVDFKRLFLLLDDIVVACHVSKNY